MTLSESALSFDPLEYRLRPTGSGSQISSIPGSDQLLRWICTGERLSGLPNGPDQTTQLYQAATLRRQHIDVLRTQGLNVPEHTSFIANCVEHIGKRALYDVVEFIAIDSQLIDHQVNPEPVANNIKQLGRALGGYLDWVVESEQKYLMQDIFLSSQYAIDTAGRTTLLDIDPLFMPIDTQLPEGNILEYARFDTIYYLDGLV